MCTPPNMHIQSNSSLTINYNAANLPAVPNLIPPVATAISTSSDFLPSENFPNPPINSVSIVEPLVPLSITSSFNGNRSSGQLRSRYVLSPQFSQVPVSTSHASTIENLIPSAAPSTSQLESNFTSMTILPTPSCFNCPSSTQQQEKQTAETTISKLAYEPVKAHWFYSTTVAAHGTIWWPFNLIDSRRLETAAASLNLLSLDEAPSASPGTPVSVRGGLYDVQLRERVYKPVYWPPDEEEMGEVRRVTWLYRPPNEQRVLPFSESMCRILEERYRYTFETDSWGERFSLPSEDSSHNSGIYIFHNEKIMLQYHSDNRHEGTRGSDTSADFAECAYLHRGLRKDLADQLPQGDDRPVKHVVFVIHGIGSIYNMRGEGLVSCINDMRNTAAALLVSHFLDKPMKGRVEFLPVRWNSSLHNEATGIANKLKCVTLRSIPKLRSYTNGTLTDILFYTSPKYCQHIVDTVAATIINLRQLFLQRNPDFSGDFSIAGHSLGSVIAFDLLSHQRRTPSTTSSLNSSGGGGVEDDEWSLLDAVTTSSTSTVAPPTDLAAQLTSATDLTEHQIHQVLSVLAITSNTSTANPVASHSTGVGLPVVTYPQLGFPFNTCFLLGSPLAIFLVARGVERLPPEFRLPTCQACVNIFHPFDPVAYRLENMVLSDYKPCAVLMPHHKGRKRLHLELKDNIARVGADISSRVYQSLRSTWRTLQEFALAHTSEAPKNVQEQKPTETENEEEESEAIKRLLSRLADNVDRDRLPCNGDEVDGNDNDDEDENDRDTFPSQLNQGRRLDYVLQEGPLESLNDYLFALSSHAIYWDSQDCLLFMLNQIFNNVNTSILNVSTTAALGKPKLTSKGSVTLHDFTSLIATKNSVRHSSSIPTLSNMPTAPSALSSQALQRMHPPLFNPAPPPSTVSLHSQYLDTGGEVTDASRTTDDSKFVEIDLTP